MRHLLATLGIGPLLVFQGLQVRRRMPLLPEAAGPRRGITGPDAEAHVPDDAAEPLRLLLVGDSSGCGVGVDTQAEALLGRLVAELSADRVVDYRLEGHTGATSTDALALLRGFEPALEPVDLAVTALGVNDVVKGRSLGRFVREQRALIQCLRERHGARRIVLSGLPPVHLFPALPQPLRWYLGARAREFDRALRTLAARERCDLVALDTTSDDPADMASDGFHPGAPVYAAWAERIAEVFEAGPLVVHPRGLGS